MASVFGVVFFAGSAAATAQSPRASIEKPENEKFHAASELVIPWRDSHRGCDGGSRYKRPNCPDVKFPENDQRVNLSLYNADGTLWYRFNVEFKGGVAPDFLSDKFKPLAPKTRKDHLAGTVVLRLVGESSNWYKVEINEETRETKFIQKADVNWAKVSWEFMFNWTARIWVDQKLVKLRDKPDGKIIEKYSETRMNWILFEKLEGDWMYVAGSNILEPKGPFYGWIRWREGRNILVGSLLNNNKIPKLSPDVEKPL